LARGKLARGKLANLPFANLPLANLPLQKICHFDAFPTSGKEIAIQHKIIKIQGGNER